MAYPAPPPEPALLVHSKRPCHKLITTVLYGYMYNIANCAAKPPTKYIVICAKKLFLVIIIIKICIRFNAK